MSVVVKRIVVIVDKVPANKVIVESVAVSIDAVGLIVILEQVTSIDKTVAV